MKDEIVYPVRVNKVTLKEFQNFKLDFYNNRTCDKYKFLRFGQAFICYMTEVGTVDPWLFYETDASKAEKYIFEHYVIC